MPFYFDRVARLAGELLGAPLARVALVQGERLRSVGLVGVEEDHRAECPCPLSRRVVAEGTALVVTDAAADATPEARTAAAAGVAAFAGVPLRTPAGLVVGSLAIADHAPRAWTKRDLRALEDLAALAGTELHRVAEVEERRRAEDALRASEERLRLVSLATNDMVWDWDLAAGRLYRSPAFESVFGYESTPETEAADWWTGRIHPDDLARILPGLQAAMDGRADAWHDEYRFRRRDGSWALVLDRALVVRGDDGRAARLVGTVADVTERHHAERALRESEARFRSLSASSPLGVFQADLEANITYANDRVREMWGIGGDAALGRAWVDRVHEEDRIGLVEGWYSALREAREHVRDYRIVVDGRTRWVRGMAGPLRDGAGQLVGAVGTVEDITERRELEEQLRQAQKIEAVGRLAGGVAHDFNNLLTVISVHAEMLLNAAADDDASREDLVEIQKATTRASNLTRQLLAFSRKQILKPQTVLLNDVVSELRKMLERLIGEDIRIALTLAPSLGAVRADPGQLEQVLVNLAVNARDAMPRGGTLVIETANETVSAEAAMRHRVLAPGDYVCLRVRDTGCGMTEETLARLFEPFFTTKAPGKGTGLGLATAYGIVKQSGGYVFAESTVSLGTTFTVYLPRVAAEAADDAAVTPAEQPGGAEGTVLLVEDEDAVRAIARRILARAGFFVLEARDGRDALAVAARYAGRIDLLVTDAVMPEMHGPELARELALARPGLRVLLMSGYTDDDVIRRGDLRPGAAFLQKPFTAEELSTTARRLLAV